MCLTVWATQALELASVGFRRHTAVSCQAESVFPSITSYLKNVPQIRFHSNGTTTAVTSGYGLDPCSIPDMYRNYSASHSVKAGPAALLS